jgi:hypothetical protein
MIESSQRMIRDKQSRRRHESCHEERHLELEIKTLQNAPKDVDKLERLLQVKQRQKEEAMHTLKRHTKGWLHKRLKC